VSAMVKLMPLVISVSLLLLDIQSTQVREILTNDDIIAMIQAKLSVQTILQKIEGTECNFSLTAKDLIELRKAGIPDEILQLMLRKRNIPLQPAKPSVVVDKAESDPFSEFGVPRAATVDVAPQARLRSASPVKLYLASSPLLKSDKKAVLFTVEYNRLWAAWPRQMVIVSELREADVVAAFKAQLGGIQRVTELNIGTEIVDWTTFNYYNAIATGNILGAFSNVKHIVSISAGATTFFGL
jgi:hypothetical protein